METLTIGGIAIVLALIYYLVKRQYSYWERKGVPFVTPIIPVGNFKELGKVHQGELFQNFYNQMKDQSKFFGLYFFQKPIFVPTDLEFIKNIMIKDFNHFQDRGLYFNEKDDPLSATLFTIEGPKWRHLRTKLTPTFTSGKMKFMYPTVWKVAENFKSTLNELLQVNGTADVEIKDLLARYTTDVIGECAFGIQCNSLQNPDAEFRLMGRRIFEKPDKMMMLKFTVAMISPSIGRFLGVKTTRPDVEKFFTGVVKETVKLRAANNIKRNDFMELLIKLKNGEGLDNAGDAKVEGITLEELTAQVFLFFLAGFETSSSVMTYAIYELILNRDIQTKARQEIERVMDKHNGECTYECMMDMTYIEQILHESLRKYPPLPNLNRLVSKPYNIPGTDVTLEKGTPVYVPIYAIQRDPQYFPNPDLFDPDRFSAEEIQNRDSMAYMSFGEGPRNCIGIRFGMMQTKVGLVQLLLNYEFSICEKTQIPLKIATEFMLIPEGGVYLNIKKL